MKCKRDKPAQFLACFEGWCRHFRAPPVQLYDEAGANPAREDRCLIRATGDWVQWLDANSQGLYRCLQPWDLGIARHNPLGLDSRTALQGWRGTRPFAAIQIILHGPPERFIVLEIDFDELNAAGGLLPLIGHGLEWAWYRLPQLIGRPQRRTNPYRIARMLRRRGVPVERV